MLGTLNQIMKSGNPVFHYSLFWLGLHRVEELVLSARN